MWPRRHRLSVFPERWSAEVSVGAWSRWTAVPPSPTTLASIAS
jgi:hypothetical protein